MPRRGENIRKRSDGRWEGRYIVSRNAEGRAIYRSIYAKSYSEVKQRLAKESINIRKAEKNTGNLTMNAVAENWLQNIKTYRKYSTYVKYYYIYYSHIKHCLGNKKIQYITDEDCFSLVENKRCKQDPAGKTLSGSTINGIRIVLSQIMEFGDKPISFPRNMVKSCSASDSKRLIIFTEGEQQQIKEYLLENLDSYNLGLFVCMLTGLRLGEICALKTDHINMSKRVIVIEQTVQRIKSEKDECKTELMVTRPKTANSNREVPICDILFTILDKALPGDQYLVNGNRVMEPRTYQYYFHRVLDDLSIQDRTFHSLRHTFATNCIASGMDPKCLCELLGHSDVKITLNRYVHPSMAQKMNQLNSFASNYGKINGQF